MADPVPASDTVVDDADAAFLYSETADGDFRKVTASRFVSSVGLGPDDEGKIPTVDEDGNVAFGPFSVDSLVVGDFFETARTLSAKWLRRDGALYDADDYPELAAIMPELADGVIWSLEPSNTTTSSNSIVQVGTRITAAFASGTATNIVASLDGGDWNVRDTITGFSGPRITAGLGIYVGVDGNGKYSTSPDGDTWGAPVTINASAGFSGIAFGNSIFVAVGTLSGNAAIYSSPDGTTWTSRTPGTTQILQGINFVNGVFIVTGNNGTIITSTNGTSWTLQTSGTTSPLYSAAYSGGTYAVVGDSGTIKTSTNLTSWTTRTSGTSVSLRAIIGSSLGFLAVGATGVARISDTGTTWAGSVTGLNSTLSAAIADASDDTKYYVVGNLTSIVYGQRTLPTQFRVPDDNPTYGWIKAVI